MKIAFLAFFMVISMPLFSQQVSTPYNLQGYSNALSILPLYTFSHGVRVDYERKIKNGDHWLVIGPQFYNDLTEGNYLDDSDYGSYESMIGYGINLYYKSIVYKSDRVNQESRLPKHSIYTLLGPNFQHYFLDGQQEVLVSFMENGFVQYQFNREDVVNPIYRFGVVGDIGWQIVINQLFIDFYTGIAIKYSVGKDGKRIKSEYTHKDNLNYSGILLDGGIRLGLYF